MTKMFVPILTLTILLLTGVSHASAADPGSAADWTGSLSAGGAVAGEYRWMRHRDVAAGESDSTSDLYVRSVEFSLEAAVAEWIRAGVTVNSEWIGDDLNEGDEKLAVDEAVVRLGKEEGPLYLAAGKRTLPFGVFENRLVTDPMTQDAYETKRVGVTLGYVRPLEGLDASVTVYKGEEMMAHLFESGLFDADNVARASAPAGDDVGSFILNISTSSLAERLHLSAAYLSEPGNGKRNNSLALSAAYDGLFGSGMVLDAEYITALQREHYVDGTSSVLAGVYKESVLSLAAAYRPGGPLEGVVRYERFDDDGLAAETGTWSVEDQYSVGGSYTFYEDEALGLSSLVAVEYRVRNYRLPEARKASMDDDNSEFHVKVAVEF